MLACHDSIHRICMDPTMPSRTDLYAELARNPEFRTSFSRARVIRMQRLCDEVLDVVDTATPETIGPVNLQVKAMAWMYGRMLPRKYGRPHDPYVFGKDPIQELIKTFKDNAVALRASDARRSPNDPEAIKVR
jgi:hypothetical protein